jgi:hypothetical protein
MKCISDSLLIFNALSLNIGNRMVSVLKGDCYNQKNINVYSKDLVVLNSLLYMNIIDFCSYLDEYNNYFCKFPEEEINLKIKEIKTICKPFIKEINKWSDLRNFRNSFIAHNMRNKLNKVVFREQLNLNIPRGIFEMEMASRCFCSITHIILTEFNLDDYNKEELNPIVSKKNNYTKEDCREKFNFLKEQTNILLKQHNRNYSIK